MLEKEMRALVAMQVKKHKFTLNKKSRSIIGSLLDHQLQSRDVYLETAPLEEKGCCRHLANLDELKKQSTKYSLIQTFIRQKIEATRVYKIEQASFVVKSHVTRTVTFTLFSPRLSQQQHGGGGGGFSGGGGGVDPFKKFKSLVESVYVLLHFLSKFERRDAGCSRELYIFVYLMDVPKEAVEELHLQQHQRMVLGEKHVNTGFTFACLQNEKNEIHVYRREEWFKVLIHELMHALGLDFAYNWRESSMSQVMVKNVFRDVHLANPNVWETYAEMWAVVIKLIFSNCDKHPNQTVPREKSVIDSIERDLRVEITFSLIQCSKVLRINNGLSYENIISPSPSSSSSLSSSPSPSQQYREDSSIFAYYVLKCILLFHLNHFLHWCSRYNRVENVICFASTAKEFVDLIHVLCRQDHFVESILATENRESKIHGPRQGNTRRNTMRMTATRDPHHDHHDYHPHPPPLRAGSISHRRRRHRRSRRYSID